MFVHVYVGSTVVDIPSTHLFLISESVDKFFSMYPVGHVSFEVSVPVVHEYVPLFSTRYSSPVVHVFTIVGFLLDFLSQASVVVSFTLFFDMLFFLHRLQELRQPLP